MASKPPGIFTSIYRFVACRWKYWLIDGSVILPNLICVSSVFLPSIMPPHNRPVSLDPKSLTLAELNIPKEFLHSFSFGTKSRDYWQKDMFSPTCLRTWTCKRPPNTGHWPSLPSSTEVKCDPVVILAIFRIFFWVHTCHFHLHVAGWVGPLPHLIFHSLPGGACASLVGSSITLQGVWLPPLLIFITRFKVCCFHPHCITHY